MESGEWGDPQRTPREERSVHSRLPNGAARALRVLENTPQGRVGVKKSRASESETLRGQVASLAKEKRDLTLKVCLGNISYSSTSAFSLFRDAMANISRYFVTPMCVSLHVVCDVQAAEGERLLNGARRELQSK